MNSVLKLFTLIACYLLLPLLVFGQTVQSGVTYVSPAVTVYSAPDSLPTASLYINNVVDATPVTVALKPGSTRVYLCTVTLPSGLTDGHLVEIKFDATVSSTALEPGWLLLGRVDSSVSSVASELADSSYGLEATKDLIDKQSGITIGYRSYNSPASNGVVVTGLSPDANAYVVFARNNAGTKEYYDFNLSAWSSSATWSDAAQTMAYQQDSGEFSKFYVSAPFFWIENNSQLRIEVHLSDGTSPQVGDPLVASAVANQAGTNLTFYDTFYNVDDVVQVVGTPATSTLAMDLSAIDLNVDSIKDATDNGVPVDDAAMDAISDAETAADNAASVATNVYGIVNSASHGNAQIKAAVDALPTVTEITNAASGSAISQEPVPRSNTVRVENSVGKLATNDEITLLVDPSPTLCAVDFSRDLRVNQRVHQLESVEISSGTTGGITFTNVGVDHGLAKFQATGVTAGDYTVRVKVTYSNQSGPKSVLVKFTVE